jgi:hypothetical protein
VAPTRPLRKHHQKALNEFVAANRERQQFQGVITSGSFGKGTAHERSDLDLYLLVTEDEFRDRRARGDLAYWADCDYPGGNIDGKIISRSVLEAAAERGSEPMRSSFTGSTVVHSSIGDLQPLVDRIPVYPEAHRNENMRDFYSQFALNLWYFAPQALERDNAFLLVDALRNIVLFAGRLMLAYNRVLFPCPKQLLDAVASCDELPERFLERSRELLRNPTQERLRDYQALVDGFTDWGLPPEQVLTRFLELDEWSWLDGTPELAKR